jgi:MFS family permease
VIEGAGVGLIGVVAPATIAMWFPPARRGVPIGIWATWVPIGTLAIFNLAPLLTASLGWQSVWWVGAGFALVMMVFYGALVRRPPAQPLDGPDDSGPTTIGYALANRSIWLLALEFACFNLTLTGMGTYYPTFLSEVRGYPLGEAAFISSITSMAILISAPLAGTLSDRIGSRRLVLSLPFLPMALLFIFPFRVMGWQIIALLGVQGLLAGGIPTATFAAAPEVMQKPQWAGLGLAAILVGQNLGLLIGPVLFGELIHRMGWAFAGYMMIPLCLLGFICGWMVKVR